MFCDQNGNGQRGARQRRSRVLGLPDGVKACLFDLDGVLTDTARVHTKAWKAMFDGFLERRAQQAHTAFVPFDAAHDYPAYIDGKTREDGVRSFLASRHIDLPEGDPSDASTTQTVYGLGNRKNLLFQQLLEKNGVDVFDGSRRYLQAVHDAGLAAAVVSSSANTRQVLQITGLDDLVQQRVDGITIRDEHLRGKPAPDSYLRGAQLLGVEPANAAVFEDAQTGVAAGRAGNFGFVVGVDRLGQADALRRNGADVVVTDLGQLLETP
ncbi:beta-phosphoglucomutase family hydrolase [Mycolicibacterium sp. BK634]|uniref:beta-phosphoglucomutase family hydrolase n=1 Tax=Mycolicibacterium sp. BK634 TaxID=2587099 RepID=UPI0016178C74|nr:beta-phosphoglucomutase family hydrolase [Mycolicibacterium sp. BK634]